MSNALNDPTHELSEFFSTIWGDTVGYVYLPTKDAVTGEWEKYMFVWPENKSGVIQHVLHETATNKEVYFGPAIFKSLKPLKENVLGSRVVWADFDGNAPSAPLSGATPLSGTERHPDPDGAAAPADGPGSGIPEPTLRVQSSSEGHEHLYWVLDEFNSDVSFIENTNRSIAYQLHADTSGWDANQILRPPCTRNFKRDMDVFVKTNEHSSHNVSVFAQLPPPERLVSDAVDTDALPDLEGVIAKYSWSDEMFDLFRKSKVETGDRSSALMRMAYFCAEVGMEDAEAYAVLLNADDRWGKFKGRNDRKQRLLDAINVARVKHPRALGDYTFAGLLGEVKEDKKFVYGFNELLQSEVKIEWLIEGLLERQGIGMVTALPSVGKTQFSLRLGIACALGRPFLHYRPTKKMKMLFLSLEMNHPAIKSFLETMATTLTPEDIETLERNFKIVPLGEVMPLDNKDGQAFLENITEEYKPDGIIIDSMGKVTYSELTDEKKIKELNGYYAKMRAKYGCSFWFIHHQRKATGDNKKPKSLADLYGNQYIAAEASVVINLWKEEDDSIEVSAIKTRLMATPRPFRVRRTSDLDFHTVEADLTESPLVKEAGDGEKSDDQRPGKFGKNTELHGL